MVLGAVTVEEPRAPVEGALGVAEPKRLELVEFAVWFPRPKGFDCVVEAPNMLAGAEGVEVLVTAGGCVARVDPPKILDGVELDVVDAKLNAGAVDVDAPNPENAGAVEVEAPNKLDWVAGGAPKAFVLELWLPATKPKGFDGCG